jgi:hypothetical protein
MLAGIALLLGILLVRWGGQRALPDETQDKGRAVESGPEVTQVREGAGPRAMASAPAETLGTGMESPEQFLAALFQTLEEPFSKDVLERLLRLFLETRNPAERLRMAALLHRYGMAQGTGYLLEVGRGEGDRVNVALAILALSRTPESMDSVVRWIEHGELGAEFLSAVGEWRDPKITAALAKRFEAEDHRNIVVAKALAQHGVFEAYQRATMDRPAGPIPESESEAVAARMRNPGDGGLKGRVSQWARAGSGLDAAAVLDITRLAGEKAARNGVEQFLGEYSKELAQWNQEYAEFIRDLRSGAREWKPVTFDGIRFESAVGLASLLGEWGADEASAEAVYGLMDPYLQGRRTPESLEKLAIALVRLDPKGSEERLLGMGMDPEALRAAQALSSLRPLTRGLIPEQVTKKLPIKIPGEE